VLLNIASLPGAIFILQFATTQAQNGKGT